MSLSYSPLPYKGILQIITDNGTKNVCSGSLNNEAHRAVCDRLRYSNRFYYFYYHFHYHYYYSYFVANVSIPVDAKEATFSGSISCFHEVQFLSQCPFRASSSENCSRLAYINCTGKK